MDWLRLEEALCSDDRSALQAPLGLVKGSPFGAKSGYEWAHEVGLSHAAAATSPGPHGPSSPRQTVFGDEQTVGWAARRGLRSCPGDPVLLEALGRREGPAGTQPGTPR